MLGKGGPYKNKLKGAINDLYLDTDAALIWIKESDPGKLTGWKCIGHIVPVEYGGVGVISHKRDPEMKGRLPEPSLATPIGPPR